MDGDADRIIYSYIDDKDNFHLVDGDKIATLVAGYIQELLKKSGKLLSNTWLVFGNSLLFFTNPQLDFTNYP